MAEPDGERAVITTAEQQAFIDYYAGPGGRAPRLTERGYEVRELPAEQLAWLKARLDETWFRPGHPQFGREHLSAVDSARAALFDERWNPEDLPASRDVPTWINREDGSYGRLLFELLEVHQRFAGVPLRPSQVWGPRVYQRHAVLARHVDVPTTHVVSSSITLAAELEAPWPLVLELDGGERVAVDLAPGQMLLYEGSRLPHYRPAPLVGEYYINVYVHYMPREGTFDPEVQAWVLER